MTHSFLMQSVPLRTLLLMLLAALLFLSAPAVADISQSSTITLVACEVTVVKDSSAQDIVFAINGESGKTSVVIAKGESVTIEVESIPSGKNLVVSYEGQAVLTKSGMTISVSNVQSERVTVTMKLASTGTGGGGSGGGGVTPSTPVTPVIPVTPIEKTYTAFVEENGEANFKAHKVIYRVTVAEEHEGKKIEIIDRVSVKASKDMEVYHQADINLHFDLAESETALVYFKIPETALKAKGLGAADACLYHYSDETGWVKLPTWYTVDGDTVFYESEAKADGPFAVVFEKDSAKPKDSGDDPVTPPTDVEPCEPCYPCIVVLLLVLLAGIGTAVFLKRRKKNEN